MYLKNYKMKKIILAIVCVYVPFIASAWGILGHRIVGEVADQYINAKTRKAVQLHAALPEELQQFLPGRMVSLSEAEQVPEELR